MRRRVLRSPQLRMRSTYAYVGVDTHSLAPGHGSQRLPQTPRQPAHERRDPHLAHALNRQRRLNVQSVCVRLEGEVTPEPRVHRASEFLSECIAT